MLHNVLRELERMAHTVKKRLQCLVFDVGNADYRVLLVSGITVSIIEGITGNIIGIILPAQTHLITLSQTRTHTLRTHLIGVQRLHGHLTN